MPVLTYALLGKSLRERDPRKRFWRLVMRVSTFLASLSALTVAAFLAGCATLTTISGNDATPIVTAVAEQVNGAAPNRKQEVQFNEAMDPSTINAQTFTVTDSSSSAVGGAVTYDASLDIASFQPNPALQTNATYKATISTAVASAGGAHLAAPYTYTFTTRSYSDTSAISVNSVIPAADATCVSTATTITITFDEAPDASTLTAANLAVTGSSGAIPMTISDNVSTTQVVLSPTAPLPSGMISVTVSNVADLAGVKMTVPYTWNFWTDCSSGSPVAYVYVSNTPAGQTQNQIMAFAADADGQLFPVPGSPFNDNVLEMAVNGVYLMGTDFPVPAPFGSPYVDSYRIESDGSLTMTSQTSLIDFGSGCVHGAGNLLFDHTGQWLYVPEDNYCTLTSNPYADLASFSVDKSTGDLTYLGDVGDGTNDYPEWVSVIGNNNYAYSSVIDDTGAALANCTYGQITGFARSNNGLLNYIPGFKPPSQPTPPPGVSGGYDPAPPSAADSNNHIVFPELPCFGQNLPVQLATYTADASGNLTTNDTYATMPATSVIPASEPIGDAEISPSGTVLAVAGWQGLEIFHFNGANPITPYQVLLQGHYISQVAWDNNNHLYAISGSRIGVDTNELYVFTVTDTSASPAPGSPYTIQSPAGLAVQPK
jgi:hypothetical protein